MAEFEFPGVLVEEAGASPKPIDGVPTNGGDALSAADRARWLYGIAIGGAALAGLGLWLAMIRGNVIIELLGTPGGLAGFAAIFVSAFVLSMLRMLVEWRRRSTRRPPLRLGKVAVAVAVFQLAELVAVGLCLTALLVSLLLARAFTPILLAAGINVLVGCTWTWMAGASLRDLLLLVQAARNHP